MYQIRDFSDQDGIVEDIFRAGYSIASVASCSESHIESLKNWESKFREAFALTDEVKYQDQYRMLSGLAIGYRRDDEREFIETRLYQVHSDETTLSSSETKRYESLSPNFPVPEYAKCAFNLIQALR
jgi:hypothetical protein